MNRPHNIYNIVALLLLLGAATTTHAQTIKGTIYGGGEMAKVDGKTNVELNTGTVEQDVFGGGKGKLNNDHTVIMSADVSETTTVTANGTTFKFPEDGIDPDVNHNIYGGGNLACKIGTLDGEGNLVAETGNTTVNINAGLMEAGFMDGDAESAWGKWIDAVNTRISTQHDNIVQGSVFGGGYGVNTSVLGMATVNINVADSKVNKAMVDVVGGGYNGYVLNNTDVNVQGVPEIYNIYGGGLGSLDGYNDAPTDNRSHANLTAYTMQKTIGSVGEGKEGDGTSVTIRGGKFYNDIFGGGAGLKYSNDSKKISYLNVAEVFGKTSVEVDAPSWIAGDKFSKNIYGGGALGLVADAISVTLKSGEFDGAQVFGGSLGEYGHLDKAKVFGAITVTTTNNDTKDTDGTTPKPDKLKGSLDIYGGCDMAQVDNTNGTLVQLNYGQFSGRVFGGGLGRETEFEDGSGSDNDDYGKVIGNTKVLVDGKEYGDPKVQWLTLGDDEAFDANGDLTNDTKAIKIYGGGALGLVTGDIDVDVESGQLYGQIFAGSLGEMGYPEKATVTSSNTHPCRAYTKQSATTNGKLTGFFHLYGGCDMAELDGNTSVTLNYGQFSGRVFGGGLGRGTDMNEGVDANVAYGKIKGNTKVLVDGVEGTGDPKPQLLSLGLATAFDGDRNLTDVKKAIKIYGGGALGLVTGDIDVDVESGNLYGEVFAGSLGEIDYPEKAMVTSPGYLKDGDTGYIPGVQCRAYTKKSTTTNGQLTGNFNVYGGCDMAKYEGITVVDINYGNFSGKIFGGGKGLACADAGVVTDYGMIAGTTEVNYQSTGSFNGDIYGGGALGLVTPTGTHAYTTQVNLWKGEINGQVFGGGFGEITGYNSKNSATWAVLNTAKVTGNTKVETTGTQDLTGNINHVYGGGDMAQVDGNTKLVITHGTFSGTIFGGGHGVPSVGDEEYMDFGKVTGTTNVLIDGPNLALGLADTYDESSAAEANAASGATLGHANYVQAGDLKSPMNIYGGGAMGIVEGDINVSVRSGTINGAVFAGSLGEEGHVNKAKVTTNATIKTEVSITNKKSDDVTPADLNGKMDIYGACDMAQFVGNAQVTINHGDFTGKIFGGGKGLPTILEAGVDVNKDYGKVIGKSNVLYDSDGTFTGSIYGGGALGLVVHPDKFVQPAEKSDPDYYITKVRLKKGTINDGYVFGGSLGEKTNPEKAMIHGNTLVVTEEVTDPETEKLLGNINHVYGGGDMAQVTGDTEVKITHGSFTGDIYGGGNGREADSSGDNINLGKVIGNSLVTIDGTDIQLGDAVGETINVYGGGALGIVTYDATVNMEKGTVIGTIYGGSFGEEDHAEKAIIQNNTNVNINGGTITGDVFGGGALAKVDKNTYVYINNGSVSNEVYGGGALADVNQDTYVYLFGGTVHDVYGGGLGAKNGVNGATKDVEAFVKGNTLVQLAHMSTTTSQLEGSTVTGSIFGCNNVNGTPKGHAKVHVLKTTPRTDQDSPRNAEGDNVDNSYDVLAVYGGGNKAAYQPWTEDEIDALGAGTNYTCNAQEKAEVLIENCDNSIAYVYGGGNAAPVPATDVKIYGANAINHAFAGGNGKGVGNKGADVGYLNFYSQGSREEYGSGLASIAVYGGTVHNVYGGSNTLGYISGGSTVSAEADADCDLNVGNVFGGGNEAPMDCDITMNIDCSDGGKILFAGANNADVNGDITLNIHSGTFEQVFCGNNQGGAVRGKLEINVEETGCTPIIIKELFGGGNLAPYSVYGYNGDGTCKTSGKQLYLDPTINVISCTAIGTVYGGGYGNTAVTYGNPIVNVDMVKGRWAETAISRAFNVIKDGEFFTPSTSPVIPNSIGVIGNIFGGGKEAAVYGNTTVNVCVPDANKDANIAPLHEEFITFGLEETNVIDYNRANRLPSTMTWEGTTGGLTKANIHMNNDAVDCINFNDSYNNESTKNQLILAPVGGFKSGDKVTIAGFYNHNNNQTSKVSLFDGSQTLIYTTDNFINGQTSNEEPNIFEYTLTADTDRLFVRRGEGSGTKTYVTKLVVTGKRLQTADVPSGSIYGGGKMANVYGNTKVHIRNGSVEGDVFGAGQGDAAQPDAALVKGKTEVIIGEDPDD